MVSNLYNFICSTWISLCSDFENFLNTPVLLCEKQRKECLLGSLKAEFQ